MLKQVQIPEAIGPYSAYRTVGNLIITSGQLPIDASTGKLIEGDIYTQATQSLQIIQTILANEQATLSDVIKFTVYLADLYDFAEVNRAFVDLLQPPYPARTAIQISELPLNGQIEIEAIAMRH
ncbi:Rid family detoxifying hydrolase [Lacticaseibacillus sp. GG6-2]